MLFVKAKASQAFLRLHCGLEKGEEEEDSPPQILESLSFLDCFDGS